MISLIPRRTNRGESAGLGIANILAGCYGGIAGCAMIGQTIVNVEMGRARSRLSNGNRRPGAAPAGDSAQPGDGEDPDGGSRRGDGDRGGEDLFSWRSIRPVSWRVIRGRKRW
ncbi:hypothetical protein LNO89_25780 [Klebsiella pneumoniae subsp. pneumoniae]|nr:hypothetical protein [Klebsiella pneumoniae subsp. pneumoniae]